jgi:hypothetical protein
MRVREDAAADAADVAVEDSRSSRIDTHSVIVQQERGSRTAASFETTAPGMLPRRLGSSSGSSFNSGNVAASSSAFSSSASSSGAVGARALAIEIGNGGREGGSRDDRVESNLSLVGHISNDVNLAAFCDMLPQMPTMSSDVRADYKAVWQSVRDIVVAESDRVTAIASVERENIKQSAKTKRAEMRNNLELEKLRMQSDQN